MKTGITGRILLTMLLPATLLFSSVLPAFETERYLIPLRVDRQEMNSALVLRLSVLSYDGESIQQLQQNPSQPVELKFGALMQAIADGNPTAALPLLNLETPSEAKRTVDLLRNSFPDLMKARLLWQVAVGSSRLFIFEWEPSAIKRGNPGRRAFVFDEVSPGVYRAELVSSARPLETFILSVMQRAVKADDSVGGLSSYSFSQQGGEQSMNPVVLEYRAHQECQQQADGTPPALATAKVLLDSRVDLKNGDMDAYLANFTPISRTKLQRWFAKMSPDQLHAYQQTMSQQELLYCMDGGPVWLLFVSPGASADGSVESSDQRMVSWHYMLKSEDNPGQYLFANAYMEGFLDDVLEDQQLFPTELNRFVDVFVQPSQ